MPLNTILEPRLNNDYVPIIVCAATALHLPVVLTVPNVDELFPVSGQAITPKKEFNCSMFAFSDKPQKEILQLVQKPMGHMVAAFVDIQIGTELNSASQCIAATNITNVPAYHELLRGYHGRGHLFERFRKYVQEHSYDGWYIIVIILEHFAFDVS